MSQSALTFIAMVAIAVLIPFQHLVLAPAPILSWILDLVILVVFLVVVGLLSKSRWDGVLVDERNKLSLSRLQTVLWSVVVIGSMVAFGLIRLKAGVPDPLNVPMPNELLIAIGITTTALVGTPIIRSIKQQPEKQANAAQAVATQGQLGLAMERTDTRGLIVVNTEPTTASWMDMLRGGGRQRRRPRHRQDPDVLVHGPSRRHLPRHDRCPDTAGYDQKIFSSTFLAGLPIVSSAFIALLGLSNGTYLANKAAPHSAPPGHPAG